MTCHSCALRAAAPSGLAAPAFRAPSRSPSGGPALGRAAAVRRHLSVPPQLATETPADVTIDPATQK
eukprot:9974586-Alexandrium_andersonii.AAC.1